MPVMVFVDCYDVDRSSWDARGYICADWFTEKYM